MRPRATFVPVLGLLAAACELSPRAPQEPTWADVEPILRAQCNHCHGSTARRTASKGALVYRLDFYDVTEASCGEAAEAMEGTSGEGMARGWASLIKESITPSAGGRARMPPAPTSPLADWERKTLLRWAEQPFPTRGLPPAGNGRPHISLRAPRFANGKLPIHVVVEDPDGEAVVGVVKVGSVTLRMDRAGAFSATVDTSEWPEGRYPINAVVCDGWGSSALRLGVVDVLHDESGLGQTTLYTSSSTPGAGPPPPPSTSPAARTTGGAGGAGATTGVAGIDGGTSTAGRAGADGGGTAGSGGRDGGALGSVPATKRDAGAAEAAKLDMRVIGECADLDGNGTLDCKESLVKNPDFRTGVEEWTKEVAEVGLAFAMSDGDGNGSSGSIAVTNGVIADADGMSTAGARQCLPIAAAGYDVAAQVFVPNGQGGVRATVNVQFYIDADCKGVIAGFYASDPISNVDSWISVSGMAAAPRGTKSMAMRLAVVKPFRQTPTKVLFDNVLLRAR
jgi:hypothetical protein